MYVGGVGAGTNCHTCGSVGFGVVAGTKTQTCPGTGAGAGA